MKHKLTWLYDMSSRSSPSKTAIEGVDELVERYLRDAGVSVRSDWDEKRNYRYDHEKSEHKEDEYNTVDFRTNSYKTNDYKATGLPLKSRGRRGSPLEARADFNSQDIRPSLSFWVNDSLDHADSIISRLVAERDDYKRKFEKEREHNRELTEQAKELQIERDNPQKDLTRLLMKEAEAGSLKLLDQLERDLASYRDRSNELAGEVTLLKLTLAKNEEAAKHELSVAQSKIEALELREEKWREKLTKYKKFYDANRLLHHRADQGSEKEVAVGTDEGNFNQSRLPVDKPTKPIDVVRGMFPHRVRSDSLVTLSNPEAPRKEPHGSETHKKEPHSSETHKKEPPSSETHKKEPHLNVSHDTEAHDTSRPRVDSEFHHPTCDACNRQCHGCCRNNPHSSPEDFSLYHWPPRRTYSFGNEGTSRW